MNKGAFYLVLAAIALVVVGGVYAYAQRPTRAVSNAVQKLSQAETGKFIAHIVLENPQATQSLLQNAGTLTINLNGSFNRHESERDSLVSDLGINAQTEGVAVELAGEIRFIADKAYLLVKKSPAAIPLLAALKDKWVELPRGEQAQASPQAQDTPLFSNVKRIGREKVAETSAVKYEAVASERAIVGFMDNLAQLLGTRLTDEQISNLRSNLGNMKELPVTFWVTPMSHELVQLETRLGDAGTRYTITLRELNKPVNHEIPEGAKPINEILGQPQGE